MTNLAVIVLVTLMTNVSNVQLHENCAACLVNPAHVEFQGPGGTNIWVEPPNAPAYFVPMPRPRPIRRETTEIIEKAVLQFEWEGIPHTMPFHNRVVSRVVRLFKARQVEEEVK
jgi:hypothetical protein